MIFVTVGTDKHDFSRLIRKIDQIAPEINQKIVIQLGCTKYKPKNCEYSKFFSPDEFKKMIEKSGKIICHGGEGSIINALKYGKKPIVVPRRKKYNEHINDHQLDLTKKLEEKNKILAVYEIENLKEAINNIKNIKKPKPRKNLLCQEIKKILNEIKNSFI
jgi:UDP-N-acetylglucosamine transferase subunit ALG13